MSVARLAGQCKLILKKRNALFVMLLFLMSAFSVAQAEVTTQNEPSNSSHLQKGAVTVELQEKPPSMQDELLKSFMASMTYSPQSMALPSDSEVDENLVNQLGMPMDVIPSADQDHLDIDVKSDIKKIVKQTKKPAFIVLSFLKPLQRMVISSAFGQRWGRSHDGIDIAANTGTAIYATEAGQVTYSGWKGGYGNFISISHGGGYTTRYGHASVLLVRSGQKVKKGQMIAKVGSTGNSTGPHLHFEVITNGIAQNPLNFLNRIISVAVKSNHSGAQ